MINLKRKKMIFLFVVLILVINIVILNSFFKREKIYTKIASKQFKSVEYNKSAPKIEKIYGCLYINIDDVFPFVFKNYTPNVNCNLDYDGDKINVDFEKKVITYEYKDRTIYDDVYIEIEEINGKNLVPLYLIANIGDIIIKLNGIELFNEKNYNDGIEEFEKRGVNNISISYGKSVNKNYTYFGENDGSLWREEAKKNIEKYRKISKQITIKNKNNVTLNNFNVKISMKSNSFLFGTAIGYSNADGDKTRLISNNIFNLIGSENFFKWKYVQNNKKNINDLIEFAESNGLKMRGHCLWWDYLCNETLKNNIVGTSENNKETMKYVYAEYNAGRISYEEASRQADEIINRFEKIVLDHIEEEVKKYPQIIEWDVINEPISNQYFKYYLYDKKFITDESFINRESISCYEISDYYTLNSNYDKFLAKCFDTAKRSNENAKMIINDNLINTDGTSQEYMVNIINDIKNYTTDINGYGIQNHVINNVEYTPQKFINVVNQQLKKVNLKKAEITEYTCENEKINKEKYIKDMLIAAYGNKNVDEFTLWCYNTSNFTLGEQKAYEETVYPWLNYSEYGESNDGTYSTRLYKGSYEATITLPNGESQVINFEVSDDSSDTINVVFDSELQSIEIKETPKTDYYRGDAIDLTEGSIIAKYDDGTSKEIRLSDNDIKILNFNTTNNGEYTLTIQYNGCKTTFDINVKENITADINKIIDKNDSIRNDYASIYTNTEIANAYNNFINTAKTISKNESENSLEKLDRLYSTQTEIAKAIVKEYNKKAINIENSNYTKLISDILDISNDYKVLYELYVTNDSLSNKYAENKINQIIERYNNNTDIDLSNETNLINQMRTLYSSVVSNNNIADNYLDKQRILKTCEIVSLMLERDIKQKADIEYKAITISSDKGINNFTNQDETITINLPKDAQITSESSNEFKFNDNGTKDVKLSIRGYDYTYTIKVNNIDKTLPKVTAQNGQSIKINAIDDNLKEIKIEKDGKETAVNNGQTITTPGIYKIIATDKAGNSANETAIVYGTYTNEQNSQVNYVTIKSKTKVRDIKQDGDYTIKDNNNIANEIKRAPSSVNTNAEKDSNSYIATGDILQDNNNTYIVITLGDLSGNGDVEVADIIKLRKSLVGLTKLTKLQELAADTNQNGSVNVSDLLKERKIMVGME